MIIERNRVQGASSRRPTDAAGASIRVEIRAEDRRRLRGGHRHAGVARAVGHLAAAARTQLVRCIRRRRSPACIADPVEPWRGPPQSIMSAQFARVSGNFGFRLEAAPTHPGLLALAVPWTRCAPASSRDAARRARRGDDRAHARRNGRPRARAVRRWRRIDYKLGKPEQRAGRAGYLGRGTRSSRGRRGRGSHAPHARRDAREVRLAVGRGCLLPPHRERAGWIATGHRCSARTRWGHAGWEATGDSRLRRAGPGIRCIGSLCRRTRASSRVERRESDDYGRGRSPHASQTQLRARSRTNRVGCTSQVFVLSSSPRRSGFAAAAVTQVTGSASPAGRYDPLHESGSNVTISLLTMGNGENVWELFGHSAVWIHDNVT